RHLADQWQDGPPTYPLRDIIAGTESSSGSMGSFGDGSFDQDDRYDEAKALILKHRKASASFLQRYMKVGYSRAARLLDALEEQGVIGPGEGAKPRPILVDAIEDEDGFHDSSSDDSDPDLSSLDDTVDYSDSRSV